MENQTVETEDLRQEILTETKGDVKSDKQPWELRMEQDHPDMVIEKKKEPEEEVKEESPSEQPAETEAAPVEEQPVKEAQPAEAKKDTANEDAYIAEYAKNTGLSVDDAKEEVSKLKAIATKYGNDPIKMAKAYREVQSAYDKQKVTASSNVNPAVAEIAANPRRFALGEVKQNQEKWVEAYRNENPARSRDMDDEQVVEALVEIRASMLKNKIAEFEVKLKRDASSKREEFIKSIPEADRRYLPEIKPVLEQLPDHQVVGDSFRFEDLVSWAKGKSVDRLIKEAEERIHKQYEAKDRKIVGEIAKTPQTTKVKQAVETSKGAGLSKYQKDQALQMFASSPMSDDEKYDAYLEVTKKKK